MTIYGSVSSALDYHAARGNSAWACASPTDQNAALLRASEYLDQNWYQHFQGYKTGGRAQVREWPREDAFAWNKQLWEELPNDEVPTEIEYATYEAALRELATPGYFNPDVIPAKNKKSFSISGGVSVEYWSDDMKPVVSKIGLVLKPLLEHNGISSGLSGAVQF